MNNNKLKNLSTFKDMNTIVYAENQEINFGTIYKSTTSNKYELDFSFLRDYNNKVPNVTSTSGLISGNTIIWEDTLSGSTVSFQFSNNERFLGSVSVDSIGDMAFIDSSGLMAVTISNSVTSMGTYVFLRCVGLTSVTITYKLSTFNQYLFSECSNVNSLTIVASSQEIDPNFSLEQLLQTWANCANNLSLNNICSITGKYLVIDGVTIDLS